MYFWRSCMYSPLQTITQYLFYTKYLSLWYGNYLSYGVLGHLNNKYLNALIQSNISWSEIYCARQSFVSICFRRNLQSELWAAGKKILDIFSVFQISTYLWIKQYSKNKFYSLWKYSQLWLFDIFLRRSSFQLLSLLQP